jgi:hypothetical protein
MLVGFTPTYFAGLSFYLCIPFLLFFSRKDIISISAELGSGIIQNSLHLKYFSANSKKVGQLGPVV